MANSFEVQGGCKLSGEITPQGAKNEALQIISAVLLTDQQVTLSNVPDIRDVNKLIDLLASLGVKVDRKGNGVVVMQADQVNMDYLETAEFAKQAAALRGSIMIVGPLLARFGKACIPKPGGDKIGRRRLDTHFIGFMNLGAQFDFDGKEEFYRVQAP